MTVFLLAQSTLTGGAAPDLVPSLGRMVLGLVVVLALLAGLAWAFRRGVIARRPAGALGVEAALPLGERRSLMIVTVEGRRLLVGLAPNHVSLVTELKASETFQQTVTRALGEDASR